MHGAGRGLGGLGGRAGDSLVAGVSRGRKARVAMARAGGGNGAAVLGAAVLLLPPLPSAAGGCGPGRGAGCGLRAVTDPLCALLGQAERQVELQRVRPAAGGAEGEGPGRGGGLCGGNGKPRVVVESPVGWQWGALRSGEPSVAVTPTQGITRSAVCANFS